MSFERVLLLLSWLVALDEEEDETDAAVEAVARGLVLTITAVEDEDDEDAADAVVGDDTDEDDEAGERDGVSVAFDSCPSSSSGLLARSKSDNASNSLGRKFMLF
jgi:hypothetical protein